MAKRIVKHGKKISTFYSYYDEELGEIHVEVIERLDDEGEQKCADKMIITHAIGGNKCVEIHKEIWEEHDKSS